MHIFLLQNIHLSFQWSNLHLVMFILILNLNQSVIHFILLSQYILISFVNFLLSHINHWSIDPAPRCLKLLKLFFQWFICLYYFINLFQGLLVFCLKINHTATILLWIHIDITSVRLSIDIGSLWFGIAACINHLTETVILLLQEMETLAQLYNVH